MSSLIGKIAGGRTRVTLIGLDKNKEKVELEIDLVETFEVVYNNKVSKHTVEKDANKPVPKIIDNVNPDNPTIAMNVILSDNINLDVTKSLTTSAKDKLKTLIYWQASGSILTLEGYTVGSGMAGDILNYLKSGIGNFNSKLDEPFYAGVITEKIENLVIGNIVSRNKLDLGHNIEVTINLERIKIADAKSTKKTNFKKKGNTAPTQVKTDKPVVKSLNKTVGG